MKTLVCPSIVVIFVPNVKPSSHLSPHETHIKSFVGLYPVAQDDTQVTFWRYNPPEHNVQLSAVPKQVIHAVEQGLQNRMDKYVPLLHSLRQVLLSEE